MCGSYKQVKCGIDVPSRWITWVYFLDCTSCCLWYSGMIVCFVLGLYCFIFIFLAQGLLAWHFVNKHEIYSGNNSMVFDYIFFFSFCACIISEDTVLTLLMYILSDYQAVSFDSDLRSWKIKSLIYTMVKCFMKLKNKAPLKLSEDQFLIYSEALVKKWIFLCCSLLQFDTLFSSTCEIVCTWIVTV